MLSCLQLGGSSGNSPPRSPEKHHRTGRPPHRRTLRMVLTTFSRLPYYFYLPLPALLNDFTLESSCHQGEEKKKKKNRFKEAQPVFRGIFKKLTLCMSALNHAMTDARIMIFKLYKGFLNVLYRKKYFAYNSISVTLADMLTIYQI